MGFIQKHWLGAMVLVMFLWVCLAIVTHDPRGARLPAILFWVFFVPWLFRGFIRFVSRAWHHGAAQGH